MSKTRKSPARCSSLSGRRIWGEVAAAKFIVKRVQEGKSGREIAPLLRWLANYGRMDGNRGPDIVLHPEDEAR